MADYPPPRTVYQGVHFQHIGSSALSLAHPRGITRKMKRGLLDTLKELPT